MKFETTTQSLAQTRADLLIIQMFENEKRLESKIKELDRVLGGEIIALLQAGDFKGKLSETLPLYPGSKVAARRILLLGLGKKSEFNLEQSRAAIAATAPLLQKHRVKNLAVVLTQTLPKKASAEQAAQTAVEGLVLSNYKFIEYRKLENEEKPAPIENLALVLNRPQDKNPVLRGAKTGFLLAKAACFARDLGNHPSNIATPSHLAKHALDLAKQHRQIKIKVLGRSEIRKENLNGLLSVSQGSEEEPKFIVMEYQTSKKAPFIVLVGKGITFDSGGISIKPSEKMEEMKYDMAGAAAVLATIKAANELGLRLNLVGLIPATENLPSGKAVKPGDIIRSRSGKTVEVVNTDAEGRLVLMDALDYAKKYKPALVVDFATLTGAIVVALGDDLIGAFTNDEKFMRRLKDASEITGEKVWPMPLEPGYEEFIKSDFADLRNLSTMTRYGDAIHAANFLKQFVDYPWVHLDIAGVAWATREKPYRPKGATGAGVRLAIEFLRKFKTR